MGSPLYSMSGEPIGLLVVLDSKPLDDQKTVQSFFELVRSRIEAEYDRLGAYRLIKEKEKALTDLIRCSTDFIWEINTDLEYTLAETSRDGILGFQSKEMLGKKPFDFMTKDEGDRVAKIFKPIWEQRISFKDLENNLVTHSGEHVYVSTSGVPIYDSDGAFKGYRGVDRDISERKKRELELQLSSTVLETASEGVMVTDFKNKIIKVNKAFTDITGFSDDDVIGKQPAILKSNLHDKYFYKSIYQSLADHGRWAGEIKNKRKNGEVYPQWLSISSMYDDESKLIGYVALFNDITLRKEQEEKITYQANYDSLTGLANRHLMQDYFQRAILHAERYEKQVALLFIDLDRFKQVNDSLGHAFGDRLLQEAALRLNQQMRRTDIASRLGGDEFAVIIPDVTKLEEVESVARKVTRIFSEPFTLDSHELFISASIGITFYPDDGSTTKTLLRNADNAMYKAKEAGRNRYQFYTQQMHDDASRRHKVENALRRACSNNEFTLNYQPIVNAETLKIVGCEALIRWENSELGAVRPDEFIPIAEELGVIEEIGTWVLNEACTKAGELPQELKADFSISVNVSSYQFQTGRLIPKIQKALSESGISPSQIVLEITERLMLDDDEMILWQMEKLQEIGVSLSIDDFGTGFSSLSYLHKYPINTLKIDRSFMQGIESDGKIQDLVQAIIAMSHRLGLKTVAEGIEQKSQSDFLASNGCDFIQGYFYGKPMKFNELLETHFNK
ncbi:MAG: EAL domain-containing protein [Neptuniibacter sp.]